jgi:outer membrane protein TolC
MDGRLCHTRLRSRPRWRRLVPARFDAYEPAWALLAAFYFAVTSIASAADAPGRSRPLVDRDQVKPAKNAGARSVVRTVANKAVATDEDDLPVPESATDPSFFAERSSRTPPLRFPRKSVGVDLQSDQTLRDLESDLDKTVTPIELPAALQLAGVQSPEVLLAQQRVLAATARQQLAAAQALPDLNLGTNYDAHTGALQQSSGAMINVQRNALYVGGGANAIGSGSVGIPGLMYNLNVGETYFTYLTSRQLSERSRAAAAGVGNNAMLQVAIAYCQLVRAQGTRAIAVQVRDEAAEVARITASFAKIGQGMPADAERALTELGQRDADIFAADAAIVEASARLAQILNLEPVVRLRSNEDWVVPRSIVPDPIPLPELIAIALYMRPEVAERRADVHAAMLQLKSAKLLLFSPQFIADFSDGAFGGGSVENTAATGSPRFGDFGNRTDADLMMYWSIRNLGLANRSLIKIATARLAVANWDWMQRLNQIRAEVADAYARTQASSAQLAIRHEAVVTSKRGLIEDMQRTKSGEGRPIEVLDSLRLRSRTQQEYLEAITTYNQAHYELYVAIGQPPADLLIHENPPTTLPSPAAESQ